MRKISNFTLDEQIDFSWLELGDITKLSLDNPFHTDERFLVDNPHLFWFDLMSKPENFAFTCKHLLNIELLPAQQVVLQELWDRPFPMLIGSRGFSKTFLLAVHTILKMLFCQGIKVVVCGAAFRQSKLIFEYVENIWDNAPILRDLCKRVSKNQGMRKDTDRWYFRLGRSSGVAIPIGNGDKIRGLRANLIIADEFRSINERIYEEVIAGFAAVSSSPVENVKRIAKNKMLTKLGYEISLEEKSQRFNNQRIISGTAGYIFETFGKYWKRYHGIITSKGDPEKLLQHLGHESDKAFDWRDFSIIRVPYDLLQEGFMEEKQISQSKTTSTESSYKLEYGAVFVEDSEGFFRRKLIDRCTAHDNQPIVIGDEQITFSAKIFGDNSKRYVMGIDPASESDNFSIVILELHPTHRRVVYSWTTTRQRFKNRIKKQTAYGESDFYDYVARKIRELLTIFPCEHIALDKMGGGIAVMEALQNKKVLNQGEAPIYPYVRYGNNDPFWWEKEDETNVLPGRHILHICQFANAIFVSQANHGMKMDMESNKLLFPYLDPITLEIAIQKDKETEKRGGTTKIYDSLEDCTLEIEELKDELASIVYTHTPNSGRERWDTPEIKIEGGKKGHDRKDRYTALLLANMVARTIELTIERPKFVSGGGFIDDVAQNAPKRGQGPQPMYTGNPLWYVDSDFYGAVTRK